MVSILLHTVNVNQSVFGHDWELDLEVLLCSLGTSLTT